MPTNPALQPPVVIDTTGEEVVERAALTPQTPRDSVSPRQKVVPFAETLPRVWLKPSPFAESA